MKHLLSINLFGPEREQARSQVIELILEALHMLPYYLKDETPPPTEAMKAGMRRKLIAIFQEISTRTRVSTEEAARMIGFEVGSQITASESSLGKGETLTQTLRMLNQYRATVAVIRSIIEGHGLHLANQLEKTASAETWVRPGFSIIVGGAGTCDHPSQVALDCTTIVLRKLGVRRDDQYGILEEIFARPGGDDWLRIMIAEILDNLHIAFVGDLLHSRVVHDWLHLAHWFTTKLLLIAPSAFQVERWSWTGTNSSLSENLSDALAADITYTIRLQRERLEKTMPAHLAKEILKSLQIGGAFIKQYNGEIMDALPLDATSPMILPEFWTHPKVIMLMQSAVGIPTRMAILRITDAGRSEKKPLLNIPGLTIGPEHTLKQCSLDEHWQEMRRKYEDRDLFAGQVRNGVVIDRLDVGTVGLIEEINQRAGVYDLSQGPILPGRNFPSTTMGVKEVLYLHGVKLPLEVAAIYGIVAPHVRLSMMSEEAEAASGAGYQRLELPLPKVVADIFPCPNDACITNCDPEAKSFFQVMGNKGAVGLNCVYCQKQFSAASVIAGLRR